MAKQLREEQKIAQLEIRIPVFFFISIFPLQKTNTEHEKGHLTDKIFKTSLISVS